MNTTSTELREKKRKKPRFNPRKHKFDEKYKDFSENDLLKELLYMNQLETDYLRKSANDINVIKWIVIITFTLSVLTGLFFWFNG